MEGASTCAAGHGWNCDPFPETKIAFDIFCVFFYQNILQMNFCHSCIGFVHSSYLSQPPQPAVVYFFLAGVLFRIENAKCWPNLANFDQFWLYCREFTEFFCVLFIDLNNAAVY